jgi:hypothetical protein
MDIPHMFVGTTIYGMMVYLSAKLNEVYAYKFFVFLGLLNYLGLTGSAYGYFIGTLGKTSEQLTVMNPVSNYE